MKRFYKMKLAIMYCLTALVFSSCQDETLEEKEQPVQFSIGVEDLSANGRVANLEDVSAIVITVIIPSGETILHMNKIPLYDFKGKFVSAPVSIKPGDYLISDFLVIDDNDNVIYATPKEGSERAYLVDNPLPLPFNVAVDKTNEVTVEVISTGDADPVLLGYTSYNVDFVETFTIGINAFIYNEDTKSLEATEAQIQIGNVEDWVYEGTLEGTNNNIELNSEPFEFRPIEIKITKPGYHTYQQRFLPSRFGDPLNPLNVTLQKDDHFKLLFVIPEGISINDMLIPSRTPDQLLFTRRPFGLYKVDISDLENPGEPEYINTHTGNLSEDLSGTLFLEDLYSTDNGETWQKIEEGRPIKRLVEFKGAVYGLGDEGVYKETEPDEWEKIPFILPKLVVHNNQLFADYGGRVSDNGTDFTGIPRDEEVTGLPADIFDVAGRLIMWGYLSDNGHGLIQFNGVNWNTSRTIFSYPKDEFGGLGVNFKKYNNQYILAFKDKQFSVIDVVNDCGDGSYCTESYIRNFRWDYEPDPPEGMYVGGDKYFVIARDDRGRYYVYGMDLSFLN